MTVEGYTQYGLAKRLLVGGVLFVYDDYLGLWRGPGELEYLASQIHSMLLSGHWTVEVAK